MDENILENLNQHIELVCSMKEKIDDTITLSRSEYNAEIEKLE